MQPTAQEDTTQADEHESDRPRPKEWNSAQARGQVQGRRRKGATISSLYSNYCTTLSRVAVPPSLKKPKTRTLIQARRCTVWRCSQLSASRLPQVTPGLCEHMRWFL